MSKKTNSLTINNLTNPAILPTALYFSVEFNNEEDYYNFVTKYTVAESIIARQILIESKIIPKYFEIVGLNSIFDLKTLIAPINMKKSENGWVFTDKNVLEDDNYLKINYSKFLSEKIKNSGLPLELAQLKKKNELQRFINSFNNPKIVDNHFCMSFEKDNSYKLCPFDYQFPQKCIFAMPFCILGNKRPIENFELKFSSGIELDKGFEYILQKSFDNTSIEILAFDLLEDADIYDSDLIDAEFTTNIEKLINERKNKIIYYEDFPVFVSFNEDKQLNIRLPFLTFDMYAQNVFLHDSDDDVEFEYYGYNSKRLAVSDILDNLGLEYYYVLGQRIDFIHEPEMVNHVIAKVKERVVIEGKIYFEESNHNHLNRKEEDASLANMVVVKTLDYPIFILTVQSDKHIVKQVNAYTLSLNDIENDMEIITEYFSNMGSKDLEHIVVGDTPQMTYCEHCLKINGIVL